MYPFIYIFGLTVPTYGIMVLLGAAAMCGMAIFLTSKKGNIPADDVFYMLLYAGIGCLIGAKLLYLIVSVDTYRLEGESLKANIEYWEKLILSGGFVFYGGLIGAFLGAFRYCKHFKVPFYDAMETVIPTVPLFHAFGRVGCFFSGCCYGMACDTPISVTFSNAVAAPNGVPLLPVQLFEAGGNLILSAVLVILFFKENPRLSLSGLYLICYGVMRFVLEFFRGDAIRGGFMGVSTSQWISIFAVGAGIAVIVKKCKNKCAGR